MVTYLMLVAFVIYLSLDFVGALPVHITITIFERPHSQHKNMNTTLNTEQVGPGCSHMQLFQAS